MTLRNKLKSDQKQWAKQHGCSPDAKGYVNSHHPDLNFFQPMLPDTRKEFNRGSGNEIISGKMLALHSSSVLACNVFDYWRVRGLSFIGKALGTDAPIERLEFEAQFPTDLRGTPPNLDVAMWFRSGEVWGIESKFTEPFGSPKRAKFKDSYFPDGQPIWNKHKLSKCGKLAADLHDGKISFRYLDAAQLLRRALGLGANYAGRFVLCYLYVDCDKDESQEHEKEIAGFAEAVAGDFPFKHLSYTELMQRLRSFAGREHDACFDYMGARYGFGIKAN